MRSMRAEVDKAFVAPGLAGTNEVRQGEAGASREEARATAQLEIN